MAGHSPVATVSFQAAGDVAARRIVRLGASRDGEVVQADASSVTTPARRPIGISGEVATGSGQTLDVHIAGIADVEAGAAVTRGQAVTTDADGKAKTTAATGNFVVGIALEAATAAGDIIPVLLSQHRVWERPDR